MDKYKGLVERLRKAAEIKRLLEQILTPALMDEAADAIEDLMQEVDVNFCPHCGAKMKEVEE